MMFTRSAKTSQDVVQALEARYATFIASGQFQPFIYPWGTVGAAVVLLYLCIDHRQSYLLERTRYLAFAFISCFAIFTVLHLRALNPAAAFGVGLISGWSILWCAVLLVFNDAQADFRRIERRENWVDQKTHRDQALPGSVGAPSLSKDVQPADGATNGNLGDSERPTERTGTFAWQRYPISPSIERLDWVADIFCNFRGMGWDWRIAGLPEPPTWVQEDLRRNHGTSISPNDTHTSKIGTHRWHTKSSLLRQNLYVFLRNYMILDLLKTLIAHDPYFWGVVDNRPPGYLPVTLQNSPFVVNMARLLISLAAIGYALEFIFALGPLFFVGLLGPNLIGARGEPWMYPSTFGSFSNVLDKGLPGWWGGWWHQTFRFAFEAPAKRLVTFLQLDPKSQTAKFIQLTLAFTLSGFLHACGSYTQIGNTRPIMGPFRFFVLQILGVAAQMQTAAALKSAGITERMPRWVRRVTNFVVVHAWFYYTAPLLVDDFAAGGVWLFEPLPISPLRGLGFGSKMDGWWCWTGTPFAWHRGTHWWNTGIAL